ncbi:hypothetical protein FHS76_000145 [Ochrobactrum daejeonense]|uniref:Uncharacterized protein n=1 Tax=Brucella daejeonensis TaxID=659015 RepID=A0A7W9ATK7_9HYPH|nr:hypothetical protein [Brucella daejeonensis]
MVGLGECRSANVDGLPFNPTHRQPGLLPTGYHNVLGETERPPADRQGFVPASTRMSSFHIFFGRPS